MVAPPKSSPTCFSNPGFILGKIWYYTLFSWCRKASGRACWWCSCKSAVVELLFLLHFISYEIFTWNNWFYMNKTSDYSVFVVWYFIDFLFHLCLLNCMIISKLIIISVCLKLKIYKANVHSAASLQLNLICILLRFYLCAIICVRRIIIMFKFSVPQIFFAMYVHFYYQSLSWVVNGFDCIYSCFFHALDNVTMLGHFIKSVFFIIPCFAQHFSPLLVCHSFA